MMTDDLLNKKIPKEAIIIPFPEKKEPLSPQGEYITVQRFCENTNHSIGQLITMNLNQHNRINDLKMRVNILWIFNSILLGLGIGQLIRKFL